MFFADYKMTSTVNLTAESTLDLQQNDSTKEHKTPFKKLAFKEKLKYIRSVITVEPLLCLYILPSIIGSIAVQNLNLELACRVNLNYSDETCNKVLARDRSDNSTLQAEIEVQKLVVNMIAWKTPLSSAVPAILVLFIGSYSDRHKIRKPFMIAPLIGETIGAIGFFLCAFNRYSWPMEAVGLSEALFPALTGGFTTMLMAVYSYVADISSIEMRTLRIGVVHITVQILFPIGSSLSGVLLQAIGKLIVW